MSLLLIVASIFVSHHTYPYNSDDVSWQTTLLSWKPFSGQTVFVGAKDNFILNVPFIYLFDHFIRPSRKQLVVEAIFFAVINFSLFYYASLYFLKQAKVKLSYASLAPFIWLASFGFGFSSLFLNTNWRDFEIGVSFIFYMLAAKYYFDEVEPFRSSKTKIFSVVVVIFAGLCTYSDPYFYYFTVIPLVILYLILLILKHINIRKTQVVVGASLMALALSRVITSVMARIGIIAPRGVLSKTTLHTLGQSMVMVLRDIEGLFGVNFGRGHFLLSLGNGALLIVLLLFVIRLLFKAKDIQKLAARRYKLWETFFAGLCAFMILAYIASDDGISGNDRYLILFVYVAVMLLMIHTSRLKDYLRHIVLFIFIVAIGSNVTTLYQQLPQSNILSPTANTSNYRLISAVQNLGLTKGYAGYWDGDINTYLSNDSQNYLPVECHNGLTLPLPLLVNGSLFTQLSPQTFLVLDPTYITPALCSKHQIFAQFGMPIKQVRVLNKTILIYNYDLFTKMPKSF